MLSDLVISLEKENHRISQQLEVLRRQEDEFYKLKKELESS